MAAQRNQETLARNFSRNKISEKEKYWDSIEKQNDSASAIYMGGGEGALAAKKNVPLGKYISQLEMKDPEARRRLKEMLEF